MKESSTEASFDELDALSRVPLDDALDALDQAQRRKLLFALLDHDRQNDSPVVPAGSEDGSDTGERHIETIGHHLPKLVDYGFIDWNPDTHEVKKGLNFEKIEPLLELLADHEDELPDSWL